MKIRLLGLWLFLFVLGLMLLVKPAEAITDPLVFPNNKIGIHILDPAEVEKVADLTNANGGDWGYVTVPLRDDDRDRIKWQKFMDDCKKLHLIPIIRLATVMTPAGWEEPNLYQSVDFANFLNGLEWPVKNRYVIIYNEPNHAKEWGGKVEPAAYARILKYSAQIFKLRNEHFFILPAGLDAAAPDGGGHLRLYNFLRQMAWVEPDVFNFIDGWNSHSYPNPGFSGTPFDDHSQSIVSFRHELAFVGQFIDKDLPVFITETGWQDTTVGEKRVAIFYKLAFEQIWNDERIVAVTPFLFQAGEGPFASFSFLKQDGSRKLSYQAVKNLAKNKGNPPLYKESKLAQILGVKTSGKIERETANYHQENFRLPGEKWKNILRWLASL